MSANPVGYVARWFSFGVWCPKNMFSAVRTGGEKEQLVISGLDFKDIAVVSE